MLDYWDTDKLVLGGHGDLMSANAGVELQAVRPLTQADRRRIYWRGYSEERIFGAVGLVLSHALGRVQSTVVH